MLLQDCAKARAGSVAEGRGFEVPSVEGGARAAALNFPSCHYHNNWPHTQQLPPGYINQRQQWTFVNKRKKVSNKQNRRRRQIEDERKWLEVDVRRRLHAGRRASPRHRSRPLHWIVPSTSQYQIPVLNCTSQYQVPLVKCITYLYCNNFLV